MFIEVNKDNINELDNSFIDKEIVLKDLESNPYGHYLILKENNEIIGYIYYRYETEGENCPNLNN